MTVHDGMMLLGECEALVARGFERWPDMAAQNRAAYTRLKAAILAGDIPAGVAALADWIDTRGAAAAYEQMQRLER